jgi:hypothetical protein
MKSGELIATVLLIVGIYWGVETPLLAALSRSFRAGRR